MTIEEAARQYVYAVEQEALPDGCLTWAEAKEQTYEALRVALGLIPASEHPRMLGPLYHLVAIGQDGSALYQSRNFRSGGKDWQIRRDDGTVSRGTDYNSPRPKPRPPTQGRWRWLSPDRW